MWIVGESFLEEFSRVEIGSKQHLYIRVSPTIRPLTGFDHLAVAAHFCAHISLKCSTMVNNKAISAAIADLNSQDTPNFGWTAKKHKVDRTTLRRRFKDQQQSQGLSQGVQ